MFFRLSISAFLSFVVACSSGLDADAGAGAAPVARGTLVFQGERTVTLIPNAMTLLSVQYLDAQGMPVAGKEVDFSLTGAASGASLTPAAALTDGQGFATTKLRVGSMQADLQVRATSDDGALDHIDVSVVDVPATTLSVQVSYAGKRMLAVYTVTALNGQACAQASGADVTGDVVYTVPSSMAPSTDQVVKFPRSAGLAMAVLAWGKDETGAKLARGCTDVAADASSAHDDGTVSVALSDTPMSLDGQLPLELELNLAAPTARFADAATRAVDAALSPSGGYAMFAEADYYLDAIAAQLAQQSASDAVSKLASLRSGTTLSASLSPALSKAGVGPKAVATSLGGLLASRGAALTLRTSYDAGQLAPPSGLSAMSADGTKSLSLSVQPNAPLRSRFDAGLAELLIDGLEIDLGLGSYGRALLGALDAQDAASLQSSLASASGCRDVVAAWWAKSEAAGLADASMVTAGCEQAVKNLRSAIETGLSALDDQHAMIQLNGSAQLYDRTEDGLVDDLGPSDLNGSWGGDSVVAELRVPAKTAFTH